MPNNLYFVGNLRKCVKTPYVNKDQQSHYRVDFELVSDDRIPQTLKLKVTGSMGDQLAALDPQPGLCSMVVYLEFHTFDWQGKTCQEIRAWKLEVSLPATGQLFVITSTNSKINQQ